MVGGSWDRRCGCRWEGKWRCGGWGWSGRWRLGLVGMGGVGEGEGWERWEGGGSRDWLGWKV